MSTGMLCAVERNMAGMECDGGAGPGWPYTLYDGLSCERSSERDKTHQIDDFLRPQTEILGCPSNPN